MLLQLTNGTFSCIIIFREGWLVGSLVASARRTKETVEETLCRMPASDGNKHGFKRHARNAQEANTTTRQNSFSIFSNLYLRTPKETDFAFAQFQAHSIIELNETDVVVVVVLTLIVIVIVIVVVVVVPNAMVLIGHVQTKFRPQTFVC